MYKKYIKRIFDIIISSLSLPFVLLICGIFGLLIYLEDKGSIFYIAIRRGKDGIPFKMYKLRSMKVNAPDIRNADNSTYNSPDDPRITKVGKFLRKTSIDELTQLFNVFWGDMSFIGPRPVTVELNYEDLDENRKKRLEVRPGITGYSQAYYRNSISQDKKIELDAYYAENVSFLMDVKIIFKTIATVLGHKNIYNSTEN